MEYKLVSDCRVDKDTDTYMIFGGDLFLISFSRTWRNGQLIAIHGLGVAI